MSSKVIRLNHSNVPLPTTTPHLMPFHIDYTGPAPLSTYFLVKPVPPQPSENTDASLAQRVKRRFTSAFRGRTMQGLEVDLPEGYSGVIFSSEDAEGTDHDDKKKLAVTKKKGKKGGRATKNSTRSHFEDEDEDGDVVMDGRNMEQDVETIKTLRPTATFSSFTLWNADVDVDEGRDEYLRALSEYQQLSAEIHRIDP